MKVILCENPVLKEICCREYLKEFFGESEADKNIADLKFNFHVLKRFILIIRYPLDISFKI